MDGVGSSTGSTVGTIEGVVGDLFSSLLLYSLLLWEDGRSRGRVLTSETDGIEGSVLVLQSFGPASVPLLTQGVVGRSVRRERIGECTPTSKTELGTHRAGVRGPDRQDCRLA